jgi:mono/diheme cytochrome c family protein/glucose/arabinose dehydrogenase
MKRLKSFCSFAAVLGALFAQAAEEFPPQKPVPALTPQQEAATFLFAEAGYSFELVLAEPDIKEPVAIAFDGNGRMFVAEMRTYMQEIDGLNEHAPVSRVSVHWSSKRDGKFDRHAVFADNLILPRMVLPVADGVLINETDSNDIYLYRDTNGDGVADKKELWYAGGRRGGNLEHQPSGLLWSIDNWIYTTYNAHRLRWTPTNVLKEPTGPNGGQWGLTQDDFGKPWFVDGGGERGPVNFQAPIVYGAFSLPDEIESDFRDVWPLVGLADVQGGPVRFRATDKTLNHFTATCGPGIFRGDRLPKNVQGDLFFAEPVGRLIRRAKIDGRDGMTRLRNAHPKSEFIRSTDPNFRPVNMTTAPDGTLFVCDMYRGIIQEGSWVREGSYLRKVVKQYSLDKNAGRGRIWRLAHKDFTPGPQPNLQSANSVQLVVALEHPNGWWRDTAQKLLVLRGDKSVAPALNAMARNNASPLARIHALWTLEGLGALTKDLALEKLRDPQPQVRAAAIRASETLIKNGDKTLEPALLGMAKDSNATVVVQAMLTANLLKLTDATNVISEALVGNRSRGVQEIGKQLLAGPETSRQAEMTAAQRRVFNRGQAIYRELCITCHGPDGQGMHVEGAPAGTTLAPRLAGSKTVLGHRDGVINVLLHGLTGPVEGKSYDALMVPMASNDDEWIAAAASYVRYAFGNRAGPVEKQDVARQRAALKSRTEPWTIEELRAALPQPLNNAKQWKLTASHNAQSLPLAIDGNGNTRYETKTSQRPGMWLQIELPQETQLAGIVLDAAKSPRDFPRGYKVEVSVDGTSWKSAATGKGDSAVTDINFPASKAKFVRITQTGAVNGLFWSVHELKLLAPGKPLTLAKKPKVVNLYE